MKKNKRAFRVLLALTVFIFADLASAGVRAAGAAELQPPVSAKNAGAAVGLSPAGEAYSPAAVGISPAGEAYSPAAVGSNHTAASSSPAAEPLPELRFALIPESARPGEPVTVAYSSAAELQPPAGASSSPAAKASPSPAADLVPAAGSLQAVLLDSRGRRLTKARFFKPGGNGEVLNTAVLAVPSTAVSGSAVIRVESADGIVKDLPFTIDEREFEAETIRLNQRNTEIRTVPDPQKTAESEQLWAVISRAGTEVYSGGPFTLPVKSTRRTSAYGSRRIYQYSTGSTDTTIHAGVDIGVPTGTEVRASAAGKVALAKSRIVTGNTVILEHLPGVYSLYYHLDSIAVSEGSRVEAGALLGESGSTGLATGPHLHWEIRVAGENADPDAFLTRPVLDKKAILDKLTSY